MLPEDKRLQIQQIFENFLRERARAIRRLRMGDLDINPFLVRLLSKELGLNDARSIVRWLVNQRLERGAVTSFGLALQNVAKVFSEGTGVEGADILKTRGGRHYYIQVKSGPNPIPKEQAKRIAELLRSAQRRNRGSVALFGMCYGSRDQVSSIVRKYVAEEGGVDWLAGREFWEFISGDPDCVDEIDAIAAEVGETFRDAQGQTLAEILEAKLDELEQEFQTLYGASGEWMWRNLLKRNT
ncbi:MAG: PmeII family type II restriction endonuclease [Anaerolineae bacterium]|jgi:hypothetical protein